MMSRFEGRTALVTGAATGIGRATAELLAENGARVICFGLGGQELEQVAGAIGGLAIGGDVTREVDIAGSIHACEGRLDIVINAAGVIVPDEPLTVSDDTWAQTLDVNLTGTMRVCRAALPLLKQRGGAIVNVASVAAFNSSPQSASYAASKAAVVSYTRSLAYAHGLDGIRANAVAPGWVRTPMSEYEMQLKIAGKNGIDGGERVRGRRGRARARTSGAAVRDRGLLPVPGVGRGIVRDWRSSRRRRRRPGRPRRTGLFD